MAGVVTALSTPFATVTGQHVKFHDAPGIATGADDLGNAGGAAGRKGKMSTRLSSLLLDDAFDNVLPLSPSLDNFLNLATTCMHGQNLLPGRLFSASAGRSLSGMGSLDLGWITEGMAMDGVEGPGAGEGSGHKNDARPAGDAGLENSGASGTACTSASEQRGGGGGEVMHGRGAAGAPSLQGPPVLSGGSFPAASAAQPQPPPSSHLHLHPSPVTSGAAGLHPLPSGTTTAAFMGQAAPQIPPDCPCEVPGASCQLSATYPAGGHTTAQQSPSLGMTFGQHPTPPSPFLQEHLAAAQAYHQQMLSYLQQAGSALGGLDGDMSGQYSSGACSTQMAWSGMPAPESSTTCPEAPMATAGYLQHGYTGTGAGTTASNPLPASPPAPRSPRSCAYPGSPLTPESAMAAAQQAQHADAWTQQVQQMELWCQQQQAAMMHSYGMGGGADGFGGRPSDYGTPHIASAPTHSNFYPAASNSSGLMPTPCWSGTKSSEAKQAQQQAALPFQLRVSTVPSFKVSTVNPVKLSQTTPTITFTPNK